MQGGGGQSPDKILDDVSIGHVFAFKIVDQIVEEGCLSSTHVLVLV